MQLNLIETIRTFFTFSVLELVIFILIGIPTIWVMATGAPFVPTAMTQVRRMLKAANIKPGMKLYDLGSGDGRLVHLASKEYGAEAVGIEYSPLVWAWSILISPFWESKAKLRYANMWTVDLSDADIIVCYLLPKPMERMKKEILPKLKPGCLIVSHAFAIPGLKHEKRLPRDRKQKLGPVHIYKIGKKSTPKKSGSKQTQKSRKKKGSQ